MSCSCNVAGANVNVEDEDGDTCLHLALLRQTVASADMEHTPAIVEVSLSLIDILLTLSLWVSMMSFLGCVK